jgi:hypothetical protein
MAAKKKKKARPAKAKRTVKTAKARKPARKAAKASKKSKTRKRAAPARKAAAKKSRPAARKPSARKPSARLGAGRPPDKSRSAGKDVAGEGNYSASRRFRKSETDFVKRNKARIPGMGKAAEAALEGAEGNELRAAEDEARAHAHMPVE